MKRRIPALCSDEQAASSSIKRTKVHAQRKFAQGSNNFVYTSPKILSKSPDSSVSSTLQAPQPARRIQKEERELNNFSSLPTIDDFLTFLCFRETEVLPGRLNYLNTPQFDAPTSKKKSAKSSNSVTFQEPKVENGKDLTCKSNGKSPVNRSKNKSKVPEYPLRSRNSKNNIVRKPSHALALKHNQRLRSKSVVKAKCSESKLQSLKNKTTALTKVIPRSPHSIKNNPHLPNKKIKARPLTRALDKKGNFPPPCDSDFRRVTRRNSTIDRNESLSQHCANQAIKKTIRIRPANHAAKKVIPVASKKPAKLMKSPLPKNKCNVTDSNADSVGSSSKPVTRRTRSGSVLPETSAIPSTTNARPSRRTKEAAALYMEMLGKELLCPEESFEDDDTLSVESFPELPNAEELNRREKELKEMHLKKCQGKVTPTARKTSTPKPKPVAKVPLPEPAATATKAPAKSAASKSKGANASDSDDAKNAGLCTRSKQYKPESGAPMVGGLPLSTRKDPHSALSSSSSTSSSSSSSSVKIIRTRLKNDIVAAAAAAGANMGRRNSYNDAFDVAKRVAGSFAKELGGRMKPKGNRCVDDVEVVAAEADKKPPETVASTESVTIKRLSSTGKFNGDEKFAKGPAIRLRAEDDGKKEPPRRSSEPVNIEQLKSLSGDSGSRSADSDDEVEVLLDVAAPAKRAPEKPAKVAAVLGPAGKSGKASKSSNADPVIIERIASRKNSELKSAKRSTGDEKTVMAKKEETAGCAKGAAAECKPAEPDRKSSIAETKSKIANHNLSVKSLTAAVEVRAKKSAATSTEQKPKVRNNCAAKPSKVAKSTADSKNAKCNDLAEKLSFTMTFDDSDDEFLMPPKKPSKPERDESDADVSSTDDQQVAKKAETATNAAAVPKAAEVVENVASEKRNATKPASISRPQTPKRSTDGFDLVIPKCELLEDETFPLVMCDDNEDCEKLATDSVPSKQEVTSSKNNESKSSGKSVSKDSVCSDSSSSGKKNPSFKKPAPQPPKSIFSAPSSCAKAKPAKEEKLPQSPVTTSQKVFSVDSKKIIFKKNSCLTPTASGGDTKDDGKKSEAFSPDNENSVYAFEPDLPTTSPPFRRLKPVTPPKAICSNSIAVQVNFENDAKIECSGAGDTQVSSTTDCGDRVFYIPIQTSADTTSTLGVAVKLGTDGPNQKIIMSAKLITDSTTFTSSSTSTSIPSKSTCVETCCTQTESTKVSPVESVTKKPEPAAAKKATSEKVVTSSERTQTIQIPCSSASSSTKIHKKSSPTAAKPSAQSVKIVKLNKNKKLKDLEIESLKSKSRPVKPKSVKKSNPSSVSEKSKAPPKQVGEILEAPTFYPSAEEFKYPLEYIDTIRSVAEKYGLCRIVPPADFRPECKVADEMRFTAYNQYVHKMLHRWGPNVKEMMAIKKFLSTQEISLTQAPLIGSMEIDLPRLYQIVQQCGGLNAVIKKERWHQVADIMKIPKLAHDRITKLDYIYCKYLLPYDVLLSPDEREKLFDDIENEWANHLRNPNDEDIFDDVDECIVKGRTMPLSSFYRIARNTMMMYFGNVEGQEGPSTEKIEEEFWNHVAKRKSHVCVHSGSIESGTYGYGFSVAKNSACCKNPWNLKVLTNDAASILRSLGPVMGVTVPTLHVGMLYSACCWYRDPHGLPWIEYLHTGANKIWYGIPDEHSEQFKEAMLLLVPRYCRDKKIWLPSDTVMIPPPLLTAQNISLSRVVQHPGQFIVVFPKAFTSSISTGYLVSESVYFAHASWLNSAKQVFKDMQDSCEPSVFSLEQLLINIAEDARSSVAILNKVLPLLTDLQDTEVALRNQLKELGLNTSEKMNTNKKRKSKSAFSDEDLYECDVCRTNLFVSMVENSHDQSYYCLRHAATLLYKKPAQAKHCKLLYVFTEDELKLLMERVNGRIEAKSGKKSHAK